MILILFLLPFHCKYHMIKISAIFSEEKHLVKVSMIHTCLFIQIDVVKSCMSMASRLWNREKLKHTPVVLVIVW